MRPLEWITAACFSGAAGVTAIAHALERAPEEPLSRRGVVVAPAEPRPIWAPHLRPSLAASAPVAVRAPVVSGAPADATLPAVVITPAAPPEVEASAAVFLNTYYEFPSEGEGAADAPLYDARCERLAMVPRAFHDRLCVQGSGQLASGATVSFARRDCACADLCPRTFQRICYEALDPARFPSGRGATGRPITPLRTVAVDPAVIPLGTPLYIPAFVGLPRPDGTLHDGCFLAEDQGLRIQGRRLDVFAGDPRTRRSWEAMVPSNRGVRVFAGGARCAARP